MDPLPKLPAGGRYVRHIFVCVEECKPKCCSPEVSRPTWDRLKRGLAERGLAAGDGCVYRSKVGCLRICEQGPIAVVYPEGVWYRRVTPDVMDRIVDEHLVGGRPVEEHVFARNPLG